MLIKQKKIIVFAFICVSALLSACEKIAVSFTPKKQPVISDFPLAKQAEATFWNTLHAGDYNQLPKTIKLLTAAYLINPNDPHLAAHLGFAHIWVIAERQRQSELEPNIVDHIILSRKYFHDAVELDPNDARILGFLGDANLAEGKIFKNDRQQVKAYFILKQAIKKWPEFNYFTAGYPMSTLSAHNKRFKEGLAWQWQTLDACAGHTVDRNYPDYRPYLHNETTVGPKRACWNSWIAPFNFEGFFLNMGDMLVKAGDWKTAIIIYNNAKLANNYAQWPYRDVLEDRIAHAKENVKAFNQEIPLTELPPDDTIMFNSRFACSGCHQAK